MYSLLLFDDATRQRIIDSTIGLAHERINRAGEFSLFQELPWDPDYYEGQAPEESYVKPRYASAEEILEEARLFCPNIDEIIAEREKDTKYWNDITQFVKMGYRVVKLTNHRNLPDVVLDKVIDAVILSRDEYLGSAYFDLAAVVLAKPITMYQYGTEEHVQEDGTTVTKPRSAVKVTALTGGVELVSPGTITIKDSQLVTDEDRHKLNELILQRREKLRKIGGYITNMAGSASEDWRFEVPGFGILVIQQTMSPGTIAELTSDRTVVVPGAVVFDESYNARVWAGRIREIHNEREAHDLQREVAEAAQHLSGETTRYIDDRGVHQAVAKTRHQAKNLGTSAIELLLRVAHRHV